MLCGAVRRVSCDKSNYQIDKRRFRGNRHIVADVCRVCKKLIALTRNRNQSRCGYIYVDGNNATVCRIIVSNIYVHTCSYSVINPAVLKVFPFLWNPFRVQFGVMTNGSAQHWRRSFVLQISAHLFTPPKLRIPWRCTEMRGRVESDDSTVRHRRLISAASPFNNIINRRSTIDILFTRPAELSCTQDRRRQERQRPAYQE